MIRPGQQLRTHIICPANKPFALWLKYHPICQIPRYLLQTHLNLIPPLCSSPDPLIALPQQPLPLLNLNPLCRQLLNPPDEHGRPQHHYFHVFCEAWVVYRLPDWIVIRSPSCAGDVEAHFFEEVEGGFAETSHVLDEVLLGIGILRGLGLDIAARVNGDLVTQDVEIWC